MPPLSVTWLVIGTFALISLVWIIIIRGRNSSDQDDTTASDKDYESHEDVICRMVNLRRHNHQRINNCPSGGSYTVPRSTLHNVSNHNLSPYETKKRLMSGCSETFHC